MARQTFEKGEAVKMYRYSGGRFGPDTWSDMVVLEPDVPKGGAWKGDPVLYYVRVTVPNPQDEWQLRGIEIKNARNLIRKASDFADIQAEIDRKTAWAKKRGDEAEARHRLQDAAPDLLAALRALEARTETRIDYCFCETAKAIDGDLPCLFCLKQQAHAAIEKAS